jgi:hypothetical protein
MSTYSDSKEEGVYFSIDNVPYLIQHHLQANDKLLLITPHDTIIYHTDILIKHLLSRYANADEESIPHSEMTLHESNSGMDTKIEFSSITLNSSTDTVRVNAITGKIFMRFKNGK